MSKVFIVGGSGKVGRHLAKQLVSRGHEAWSMYRNPDQAEALKNLGARSVLGDLLKLDTQALAELMGECDTVVFSAGAGGKGGKEMTDAIDGKGLELAVAAAQQAGIQRFLLVSAFPEAARGKEVSETFENYMAVKKQADVHLSATDLDWVIVRPGLLLDDAGTQHVHTGLAIPYGEVAREDVASTLLEIIEHPAVNRVIIELTQGEQPVAEAVAKFAK
ncbi:NAD(P)-binding oxidoreductase [Psychrobacter aquimaris]|uniref:NAD(P)-binding oxidoreductase n=1 Tax=Psychrobacter aquimaris TaxID=292733 RepID=UPI0018DF5032|nr:NAD(P)-binding oxidoreductase [Psychrobacter aquimaris]